MCRLLTYLVYRDAFTRGPNIRPGGTLPPLRDEAAVQVAKLSSVRGSHLPLHSIDTENGLTHVVPRHLVTKPGPVTLKFNTMKCISAVRYSLRTFSPETSIATETAKPYPLPGRSWPRHWPCLCAVRRHSSRSHSRYPPSRAAGHTRRRPRHPPRRYRNRDHVGTPTEMMQGHVIKLYDHHNTPTPPL